MNIFDYILWTYVIYLFYILYDRDSHMKHEKYNEMPKLYGLDDYDGCMRNDDAIFCSLRVQLFGNNKSHIWRTIQEVNADRFKYFRHDIVHRGVCLSNKCNISKNLYLYLKEHDEKQMIDMLNMCLNQEFVTKYNLKGRVSIDSCKYVEEKSFTLSQWSYLFAVVFCIILCISGSFLSEDDTQKGAWYKILAAFSFRKNWTSLMRNCNVNAHSPADYMPGIQGLRTLFMLCITFSHIYFYIFNMYCKNPEFYELYHGDFFHIGYHNGSITLVQQLLCMSAFLMSYNLYKDAMKAELNFRSYPKLVLKRWLRFTPVHLFVIGYIVLWSRYINGDYPLLKLFYIDEETCSNSWWANILYISNWNYQTVTCILNVWYLSVDFQMYCIMTIILIVCWKLKRFAKYILGASLLTAMFTISYYIYIHNFIPFALTNPENLRIIWKGDDDFEKMYLKTYTNTAGYVTGAIAGHLYFVIDKRKDKARIINWLEKYSPLSAQLSILLSLSAAPIIGQIVSNNFNKGGLLIALYSSFSRTLGAFGTAVLLLAIAFKTEYSLKAILESKIMIFLGSVSYSTVMVHLTMYNYWFSDIHMRSITSFSNLMDYILAMSACCVAGTLVYFVIEMPFCNIQKILLRENSNNNKCKKSHIK